ncbi:protein rolling stone-like isoform X3 [Hypanus sabinus]|uniref:protein rolling stone-like isoform X3 n=1 Tax=Hypanus sabinus TaxID=79690 RepID=UPI0028C4D699|nr:protein rolling stone-like isoform X3 [Hypanus sabinus]
MGSSWIKRFTQEFTTKKISPIARKPQLILQSQWRLHPVIWLCYRIFMAVYSLAWCIRSGIQTNSFKWFIFLTHLTYTMLTAYFNLALINLICCIAFGKRKETQNVKEASSAELSLPNPKSAIEVEGGSSLCVKRKEFPSPPSLLRHPISIQWDLLNMMCVISLYVTIAFWSIDYVPGLVAPDSININVHVVNSVLVLLELGMTAAPIHLAHFVYVLLYCLSYILFTIVYWALGGTNLKGKPYVYRILNYSKSLGAATGCIVGSLCVILQLLQFLVWNLHLLKHHIYLRLMCKDNNVSHR